MKKSVFAAGIALATLIGSGANAASVSFETFDINVFNTKTAGGVVEDFEEYSGKWNQNTTTNVGKFRSTGGTGTGSVCNAQSDGVGNCKALFINDLLRSGQGNLVPLNGSKALSSNDTNGIFWDVSLRSGKAFGKIIFAVNDAADISGTTFNVLIDGVSKSFSGQANNNKKLVVIDLGGKFANAQVSMFNTNSSGGAKPNDGFTIDGATIAAVVPLPAAGFLFLGGLGMLGALRKRKQKTA